MITINGIKYDLIQVKEMSDEQRCIMCDVTDALFCIKCSKLVPKLFILKEQTIKLKNYV